MSLSIFGYYVTFTKDTRLDDLAISVHDLHGKVDQLLEVKQAELDEITARLKKQNDDLAHDVAAAAAAKPGGV